jgi:hypothetical protein
MVKYKKAFNEMLEDNQNFFNRFKQTHDNYSQDKETYKDQFNEEGTKALRIIRRYENALCAKSENSSYGKFSSNLSDKFWEEVRAYLPLIDQISMV